MMIRIQNVSAEVVNEARDTGHNPPAILTMNQEDDRFFSVCQRGSLFRDESNRYKCSRPTTIPAGNDASRIFKKATVFTRPTLAVISPARPESAKAAPSPKDAPCPKQGRGELSLIFKGWVGEGLQISQLPQREQADCSSLRASSDHRFIVGALRARRTVCLLPHILLGRALREQGDRPSYPNPLFQHPA